jgi:hypothetical protein
MSGGIWRQTFIYNSTWRVFPAAAPWTAASGRIKKKLKHGASCHLASGPEWRVMAYQLAARHRHRGAVLAKTRQKAGSQHLWRQPSLLRQQQTQRMNGRLSGISGGA